MLGALVEEQVRVRTSLHTKTNYNTTNYTESHTKTNKASAIYLLFQLTEGI